MSNEQLDFFVKTLLGDADFVYLGMFESSFVQVFSQFGHVVKRLNTPKPKPSAYELWEEVAS